MNNLNFDINNYLTEELEKLLNLNKPYDRNNLFDKVRLIKNDINNSNLSENKRTSFNIFLDNAYTKLTNELLKNENGNQISQYDSNHFLIKNKNKSTDSILESNKKINKSIIKKSFTIDSMFRENYGSLNNPSNNFSIDLPETVNNALTLSISSLEFPLTYHNVSRRLNNNVFNIRVTDICSNTQEIEEKINLQIELVPGLYEAFHRGNNREVGTSINNHINERIKEVCSLKEKEFLRDHGDNFENMSERQILKDICNNLIFNINNISGNSFFSFLHPDICGNSSISNIDSFGDENTIDTIPNNDMFIKFIERDGSSNNIQLIIDFDVDNLNAINEVLCKENYLYQKLGWSLGYRRNEIIFSYNNFKNLLDSESLVNQITLKIDSENICFINYPRYLYIAVDDYQTSSRNFFSVAANSIIAPNIIGRINIQSVLEDKGAYKSGAVAGDYDFSQKLVREYFGPTNIKKLKITIYDQYGRIFPINESDWSFIASFECLYN